MDTIFKKKIAKQEKDDLTGDYWKRKKEKLIVDKSKWPSNGCYRLDNEPLQYRIENYESEIPEDGENLEYDCFMPTGQVYEFLPCGPYLNMGKNIGYKKYRGMHRIMDIEGEPREGTEAFVPYKLLLYRGRLNYAPDNDDGYRFVYLAQNKSNEPVVGDCFIRLEVIHKRVVSRDLDTYIDDCNAAITHFNIKDALQTGNGVEEAIIKYREAQRKGRALLTFRCWSVEGVQCATHELELFNRLYENIGRGNTRRDHLGMFSIWAELLRKSQGDKLASKDFFGRYWDAVVPTADMAMFATGFLIVVSERYLQYRGDEGQDRDKMKQEVYMAVKRVLDAPRLKFKPTLSLNNVVFFDQIVQPWADGWFQDGWRSLEGHPGGLYSILVTRPVREFLCRTIHDKPLWQEQYPAPPENLARELDDLLTECGETEATRTEVKHEFVVAARKGKRTPTQDKCVATKGYSANAALSKTYPGYYPSVAKAKKRRVAEWLHRSAFSYGGIIQGNLSSSQVPNNLVLGTPDTNTVMMRYEAFVKRLAYYSNEERGDTVVVVTEIHYPALVGWGQNWIGNARYTWLAPRLFYGYRNDPNSTPHVLVTRDLHPLNRETCMLFEALLDKSMESVCWKWNCWGNNAVAKALMESTAVDGDQDGPLEKDDLKDLLKQAVHGDQEGPLPEVDLEDLLQQELDQRP